MATTAELQILIRARDEASRAMQGIGGAAGKMGQAVRRGALLGAGALAGVGIAAVKMGADFQTAFAEVTTLFDLPKAQVDELRQGVLDLSGTMGLDAVKTTKALYQAISAGVAPAKALAFIEENAKLAIGGVTDLETAVDLTTTALNAFGLQTEDVARVNDVLFTGVRLGKTTIAELGASLFQVAPIASAMGVSIEQTTAAIAVLTTQGVPTRVAATQIRQAIAELGKEGTIASSAFQELTGETFPAFIEGGGTLVDALELMRQGAEDSDKSLIDMFGSIEAGQAALALTTNESKDFQLALLEVINAGGATDAAFEKMNETFGRQFEILKSQVKVALIEIGLRILPPLTAFLQDRLIPLVQEGIPRAVEAMKAAWEDVEPVVVRFLDAFKLGLDTLQPFVEDLFNFVKDNKPVMITAITAIGVAIVLAFGPVSLAIVAIVGLIAAIGLIRDNWEELRVETERILGEISTIVDDELGFIDEVIIAVIGGIVTFMRENWDEMEAIVFGALDRIKIDIVDQLTFIRDFFRLTHAVWQGDWQTAWDIMGRIVSDRLDFIRQRFETDMRIWQAIFKLGMAVILTVMVESWQLLPARILAAVGDLGKLLYQAGRDLVQGFIDGINSLIGSIPSLTDLIPIPGNFNIPGVPFGAHGGIVTRPTLALLGEAGPEAVVPLSRAPGAEALPGLPQQNITINITVKGDSPGAIAHELEMVALDFGQRLAAEGV